MRTLKLRNQLIESLEGRLLFNATIVVNSVADGFPSSATSLREAVLAADSSKTITTITFDPAVFSKRQTIVLNGNALEFSNRAFTTILKGPSAGLTISGNSQSEGMLVDPFVALVMSKVTITDCDGSGVDNEGNLTLSSATLAHNSAAEGAGLDNTGNATLTDCTISNNTASDTGGGIDNSGTLDCTRVILNGNIATDGGGGGIANSHIAHITDAIISNNSTTLNGGGLLNTQSMTVQNASIWSNDASNSGGGVFSEGFTTLVMTNCTVATNSTFGYGGGIDVGGGHQSTFNNLTVAGNSASLGGGGVFVSPLGNSATINNSIVTTNTCSTGPDVSGSFISPGYNLIGATDGSSGWNKLGPDLVGTAAKPLSAKLSSLANYGGFSQTMLPLPGSLAIDSGSNNLVPLGVDTDQRDLSRISGGRVDLGAAEIQVGDASIAGNVFLDKNGDGIKGVGDTNLAGWQVFIDSNNNGKLDAGEISVRSRSNGNYTFSSLFAGTYRLRLRVHDGYQRTAPAKGSFNITLSSKTQSTKKYFGVTSAGSMKPSSLAVSPSAFSQMDILQPMNSNDFDSLL